MANLRRILFVAVVASVLMAVARAFKYDPDVGLGTNLDYPGLERDTVGHGLVADMVNFEDEMMLGSETNRRQLYNSRYISNEALRRNSVPCGRRGQSYYNCKRRKKANPYRRGCSRVTRCARNSK